MSTVLLFFYNLGDIAVITLHLFGPCSRYHGVCGSLTNLKENAEVSTNYSVKQSTKNVLL